MRCPKCGVEQPLGVTVCGFCGAPMAGDAPSLRPEDAELFLRGAAQAGRAARLARRWLGLGAAAAAIGLVAGWVVFGAHKRGEAAAAASVERVSPAPSDEPRADEPIAGPGAAPAPSVVRGGGAVRLDESRLSELADDLASAAERGDGRRLAGLLDARLRYKVRVDDAGGARELRGGKPELLAHWLAPWLVDELYGEIVDQTIDVERLGVDADRRRGQIVRRIETVGDVSAIRFSRPLLEPLALRGEVDLETAARLELSPLRVPTNRCRAIESLRVAVDPAGIRIVEAERVASCRPLR